MEKLKPVRNPNLDCDTTEKGSVKNPSTRSLETIAEEIKKCQDTSDESYLKMGRLLLEAKNRFGKHGEWLKWLQDNVDIPICKVQRLMRVAKWVDSNEAPVPHLDFTKAYILSRLSREDLEAFKKDWQIEDLSKRELKRAVHNYLLEKASMSPAVAFTTRQQAKTKTEDDLRQRFDKILSEVAELASLVGNDSGTHGEFAVGLRELCQSILQRLSTEDIEDD